MSGFNTFMFSQILLGESAAQHRKSAAAHLYIRGPDAAVPPEERRTGALFAPETQTAIEQTFYKPLEANRNLARSIMLLLTIVFPTATLSGHPLRFENR